MEDSPRRRDAALGFAAIATCIAAYASTPAVFYFDDAYISLHSARTLLTGTDPIFGTPALTGVTSPPYVALLSLLLWLRLPALRLAVALGVATFACGVYTLGRTCGASHLRSALLVVLALATGYTYTNAINGIETGWAMAVATWLLVFALRDSIVGVSLLTGLLPLLRPDLAVAAGATWLAVMARRRPLGQWVLAGGLALAVAAPTLLWVRVNTGAWMPQTMSAKAAWFAEACLPQGIKLDTAWRAIINVLGQLLPVSIGLIALVRSRVGRAGLFACVCTLAVYAETFPGGLYHNFYRYPYAVVVPWAVLGMGMILASLPVTSLVNGAIAFAAAAVVWISPGAAADAPGRMQKVVDFQSTAGWLDAHTAPQSVLLIHDAGAISEFGHRSAVDVVGLKTPSSIRVNQQWTFASCGRDRATALGTLARNAHASYLVVTPEWDSIFGLRAGLARSGFTTVPLYAAPYKTYEVFALVEAAPPPA